MHGILGCVYHHNNARCVVQESSTRTPKLEHDADATDVESEDEEEEEDPDTEIVGAQYDKRLWNSERMVAPAVLPSRINILEVRPTPTGRARIIHV